MIVADEFMESPADILTSSELAKSIHANKPKPTPPNPRPRKKSRTSFPPNLPLSSTTGNNTVHNAQVPCGGGGSLSPPYGLDPAVLFNYMNTPGLDMNTLAMMNAAMTAGSTNEFGDIAFYQDPVVTPSQPMTSLSLGGEATADNLFRRYGPMFAHGGQVSGGGGSVGSGSSGLSLNITMRRSFSNDISQPDTIYPSLVHSQLYAMANGSNGNIGLGQFGNFPTPSSSSNPMSMNPCGGGGTGGNGNANAILRVCTDCGSTESPEWRKGPAGPKTLCNACGLRWAKQVRKDLEEQKQQQQQQQQQQSK